MTDLIIIIPILNEETILLRCYDSIRTQIKDSSILFIDDGSSDNSLGLIKNIVQTDKRVFFVSFSRNFGKEAAIFCGLEYAQPLKYKFTCIMDVDGQDPPEYLVNMYEKLNYEYFDAVACRRINRKGEDRIRSLFSSLFYKIINCLTNVNIPEGARDYIMMNEQFRNALLSCKEKCRFFKGLYNSIGYRVDWIEYENLHIKDRKSRCSIMKLVAYALEGIIIPWKDWLYVDEGTVKQDENNDRIWYVETVNTEEIRKYKIEFIIDERGYVDDYILNELF